MHGAARPVLELDAIQSLTGCASNPVLDVRKRKPKPAGDLPQCKATSCQYDQLAPVLRRKCFMISILRAAVALSASFRLRYAPPPRS